MDEPSEAATTLIGTGWQVAVDMNPHTGRWHWIAWQGPASFSDKTFVEATNRGLEQHEATRNEAIESATRYCIDQMAGWVEVPMDFSDG